jgi:GH24 family phage-related lysozyme (muramidase)
MAPQARTEKRNRSLSEAGAKFIAEFEGFSGELYNDPTGNCTIGYGHMVHIGKCDGSEPKEFRDGITKKRAIKLLQEDAATAGTEINRSVTVPLTQTQFDALVSFVFNVGTGAFRDSTLLRLLNKGRYESVPKQLNRWVFAQGEKLDSLVRRRKAEGRLFRDGKY